MIAISYLRELGHKPIFVAAFTLRASQVAPIVKNPPANAGHIRDTGSILGLGRSPEGRHGTPLQYSCLANPHGQRSLGVVGVYTPQDRTELDTTEATGYAHMYIYYTHTHTHTHTYIYKKIITIRS